MGCQKRCSVSTFEKIRVFVIREIIIISCFGEIFEVFWNHLCLEKFF